MCIRDSSYSSSIYPIRHDHYGMPDAPRFAHQVRAGLLEVPVTTARFFERNWPASGGGYFRLLPYAMSRWLLQSVNRQDRQSAVFYFHPWEIDAGQPRVEGVNAKTRFRHYVNCLLYTSIPEFWDGKAAERIAADLSKWLIARNLDARK